MKKLLIVLGVLIIAIVVIVIIKKNKKEEMTNFAIGEANVTSVSTTLQESFPVGVRVSVSGNLPDTCTELGDILQSRDGKDGDFVVTLQTKRPLDMQCAQVLSAFDTSFILEGTDGLTKGDYAVVVNGVASSFTFDVDNFISQEDTLK